MLNLCVMGMVNIPPHGFLKKKLITLKITQHEPQRTNNIPNSAATSGTNTTILKWDAKQKQTSKK